MSINPIDFYDELAKHDIHFFTGVPDSTLKEFCLCIDDQIDAQNHIITANEGSAISLASGYFLAKKSIPLVYMQNSGFGNAINPLLSLCDPEVYSIPLVIMMGWRGEPGIKDEPQHIKQGKIQIELLETLGIPYEIISKDDMQFTKNISKAINVAKDRNTPVVILIKKNTFSKYKKKPKIIDKTLLLREKALELILDQLGNDTIVVSTTGKTSREIFEIRERKRQSHRQDFLTVGSMGHCSSIALGIALAKPNRKVVCIDGDGSMLMHLGNLTTIATLKPKNLIHILLNNEVHESVGGQETAAKNLDLTKIIKALGGSRVFKVESKDKLINTLVKLLSLKGPIFLEIKINQGSRDDLGRPTVKPIDNKVNFMNFLKENPVN